MSNEYSYVQDGQAAANLQVKLTGGTAYRKTLSGTASFSSTVHFSQNGSYTIKITLMPKYKYLFSDGTTDYLANKGSRKPVAVVVRENNGTPRSGLAFALNKANHGNIVKWCYRSNYNAQNNHPDIVYGKDGATNIDGYNITWNAAYDKEGKIKGNEQTIYPAFYYAGHYNEELAALGTPITGSNIGKWYLGSIGEWYTMLKAIAYSDEFEDAYQTTNNQPQLYYSMALIKRAFEPAGGNLTKDSFWTALEARDDYGGYFYAWFMQIDTYVYPYSFSKDSYNSKYAQAFVNF